MQASTISTIVTDGIADYSTEMVTIVGAAVVIIVAFFVVKRGIHFFSAGAVNLEFKENGMGGNAVEFGEWREIKDPEYFGKKWKGGKMRMRRRYEADDNFDEYEFNGKKVDPWID